VRRALLVLAWLTSLPAAVADDLPGCGLDFLDDDAPSSLCLGCHESGRGIAPQFRRAATHPFDVPYRAGPLGSGRLRPSAEVAGVLQLPGGRVTCTTCHVRASPHSFRLARSMSAPPRSERLCDTCHVLPE
jgi:hypothetical protein